MRNRVLMLLVLFLGHTAVAGENYTENLKETWGCYAILDTSEKKVLVRLTRMELIDDDSGDVGLEFGSIFVAGSEYIAMFSVEGFDRRWDFGESPGDDAVGERAFVIHPDGTGLLYDFTTAEDGEEESPERFYNCVMEESNRLDAIPAEIERQRLENERLRREADAARQAELDAEPNRLKAMPANAEAAYIFAIQQKIVRNWVRPPTASADIECIVNVRQLPGGEVVSVNIGECNADSTVKRSIEAAVHKASPLPAPKDPSAFDRNLRLEFRPTD